MKVKVENVENKANEVKIEFTVEAEKFNEAIEKLSSYISYSGRKYKDHYAVLKKNNWVYNEIFNAKNQQQKEEKSNDEFNYV